MTSPVTIIGAGWAGLAAAVTLCSHNIPVQVYESARQPGGRARSVSSNGMTLDNGQHLMIGAYREMLQLLRLMKADERDLFLRLPQTLEMLDSHKSRPVFELSLPRLPAPWHLVFGLLSSPSLTLGQKIHTLRRFNTLLNTPITHDRSVSDWLADADLPQTYVDNLLKPLCLAALTTHPHQASARAFQTVLVQTFRAPRAHTDLLIAKKNLGDVFPRLARDYIESHGGKLFTEHRLNHIRTDNGRVAGLVVNDQHLDAEQVILATPPGTTRKLLSGIDGCETLCRQLDALTFEPVTTVYLQYPPHIRLSKPMIGLLDLTAEWLFDRRVCRQPGLMAAVISAGGEHQHLDNAVLIDRVAGELSRLFNWPAADRGLVIREKRACIRCTPDIDKIRPGAQTPIANLLLCGDYVYIEDNGQAGLPSTLEGALRSGVKCAQILNKEMN